MVEGNSVKIYSDMEKLLLELCRNGDGKAYISSDDAGCYQMDINNEE